VTRPAPPPTFSLAAKDDALGPSSQDVTWTFAGHAENGAQRRDRVADRAVARLYAALARQVALARHIFEHGVDGRFYSQTRKYHREGGKVYWSMDPSPEATDLVNRCDEAQTYEARFAAGTLPNKLW